MKLFRRRSPLAKFVTPDDLAALEAHPYVVPAPRAQEVSLLLIQIRDDDINEVQTWLARVVPIVQQHHGNIDSITVSLVVAVFGFPIAGRDHASDCHDAVAALLAEENAPLKMVSRTGTALCGIFGTEARPTFGPMLPGFSGLLARLCALDCGQAEELR